MKTLRTLTDKTEIITRVKNLTPDSPRQWGRMTPHQMLCHLSDSFRMVMGERPAKLRVNFFSRTVMKWLALQLPVQWPHGVKTGPEADQEQNGTRPVEFERDRHDLLQLIERFSRTQKDFSYTPHPIFGEMTEDEWQRWGWLHLDHHLRQFNL